MRLLLLSLMAVLTATIVHAQVGDIYIVNVEKLNLRSGASSTSESFGLLGKGSQLYVLEVKEDWFKVEFSEYVGWVRKEYLLSKKENNYAKVNLHTGASPDCENINWLFDTSSECELKIKVGKGADFAVKLMDNISQKCIRAVYIRSGESIVIKNIPRGIFYLKIANGLDFRRGFIEGKCIMVFNRRATYEIGEDTMDFNPSPTRIEIIDGERYEVRDVPRYEVFLDVPKSSVNLGENLQTNSISAEEFNR